MWMTPPEDVTCVLDPQPAVTAMQSTTTRTAARFTPGYIRHRAPNSHMPLGGHSGTLAQASVRQCLPFLHDPEKLSSQSLVRASVLDAVAIVPIQRVSAST